MNEQLGFGQQESLSCWGLRVTETLRLLRLVCFDHAVP